MTRTLHILVLSCAVWVAPTLFAKTATIEWKSFDLATKYHLQIRRAGDTIVDTTLEKTVTKWSGNLEPGTYQYRIRVYDRVGRPGKWSDTFAMVVKPDAPKPSLVENAEMYPDADGNIVLSWERVPNVEEYRVVILRNAKPVYKKTVNDTRAIIGKIPPGEYAWQVQGLLPGTKEQRGPASTNVTSGDLSTPRRFAVQKYLYIPRARFGIFSASGPYNYRIQNPNEGRISAFGMTAGASGDLWLSQRMFLDGVFESQFVQVEGSVTHLADRRLHVNYAPLRATGDARWEFSVGLGPRFKEYMRVLSSAGTYNGRDRHTLLSADTQLRLRHFLTRTLTMGLEFNYLFGMFLIGEGGGIVVTNPSKLVGNFSTRLSGQLLLSDRWEIELALFLERNALTFSGGSISGSQAMDNFLLRGYAHLNFRF
ncbi:MAG: hypothetical protein KDD51_10385 [Bdellovibrionales bacterium]|nr:hypothetical protein [Bdellovibrionales bacterium]